MNHGQEAAADSRQVKLEGDLFGRFNDKLVLRQGRLLDLRLRKEQRSGDGFPPFAGMMTFTAGVCNVHIPAKAGIQFYSLNHSSMITGITFRVASTPQGRGQRYESD
jgi:hypothetical protein